MWPSAQVQTVRFSTSEALLWDAAASKTESESVEMNVHLAETQLTLWKHWEHQSCLLMKYLRFTAFKLRKYKNISWSETIKKAGIEK